jgi:hypothetical protein
MELYPSVGTPLDEIEPFTQELTGIVATMQEKLSTETKILEGTMPIPDYEGVRDALQNELSIPKLTEEQWRTSLGNGSLTTDPTLISMFGSSSSSSSAEPSNPASDTPVCGNGCSKLPTDCCEGKSADCGCATDASNECCACMVQMINVPTVGMPSEEK